MRASSRPPRLAVVGVHGYGASHVLTAQALARAGRAELVGLVDPVKGPVVRDSTTLDLREVPHFSSLPELLAATGVDVVVVATPLHTHAALARQALQAGADVLLEKPPVTSRDELSALLACQQATGGLVQVGFQSLGSLALAALARGMLQGALGVVSHLGARGSWSRDRAYYARAPWAGRRQLTVAQGADDGSDAGGASPTVIDVVDGALTNPFAHAVMDLLWLAGRTRAQDVGAVEVDLYHAHDIEADDTASLRIGAVPERPDGSGPLDCPSPSDGSAGPGTVYRGPLSAAFTLAGPREALPVIEVRGSLASARLFYTQDRLEVDGPDDARLAGRYGRLDLLEDLLAVRAGGGALLAPLSATGGFVEVVEAVRATVPARVDPGSVRWHGTGGSARPVIDGIDDALAVAVREALLFREMDLPWTR